MEENKKIDATLPNDTVKDYYTKEEVDSIINAKLDANLKDLLVRFSNIQPKVEEPKKEEVKKELSEKELMF